MVFLDKSIASRKLLCFLHKESLRNPMFRNQIHIPNVLKSLFNIRNDWKKERKKETLLLVFAVSCVLHVKEQHLKFRVSVT